VQLLQKLMKMIKTDREVKAKMKIENVHSSRCVIQMPEQGRTDPH
jgi:hypothetical protein